MTKQIYEKYRFEQMRLDSYREWPVDYIAPRDLAGEGFYYTGEADRVTCFCCGLTLSKWMRDDDPKTEHLKWRETCRFFSRRECGNVPLGADPLAIRPVAVYDNCLRMPVTNETELNLTHPESAETRIDEPIHPEFAEYSRRLESFTHWPGRNGAINPIWLAAAGLFYNGITGEAICFQGGEIIRNWEQTDDPWLRHANLNPTCAYLIRKVGPKREHPDPPYYDAPCPQDESLTRPRYPEFTCYLRRIESLTEWPGSPGLNTAGIARAGFFYRDNGNYVLCFYCGKGVDGNKANMDPWYTHAFRFPHCPFSATTVGSGSAVYSEPQLMEVSEQPGPQDRTVPSQPGYIEYSHRLESLALCPKFKQTLNPVWYAAAGFFYTGVGDKLMCFHCGEVMNEWKRRDDPWKVHHRFNPSCKFVNDHITRHYFGRLSPRALPLPGPLYPEFTNYLSRIESFLLWPERNPKIKTLEIIRAGFFFKSNGSNLTSCFYCGRGIIGWNEAMEPWHTHAVISPQCPYLATTTGSCKPVEENTSAPIRSTEKSLAEELKEIEGMLNNPPPSTQFNPARSPPLVTNNLQVAVPSIANSPENPGYTIANPGVTPNLCRICLKHPVEIVYLPCLHAISCKFCDKNFKNCEICQAEIGHKLRKEGREV